MYLLYGNEAVKTEYKRLRMKNVNLGDKMRAASQEKRCYWKAVGGGWKFKQLKA